MIRHIRGPDKVRTGYSSIFKNIQEYSGILMHIQPHSQASSQGGGGSGFPCPFLKMEKSVLILEENCPDCVHLWVKFSIQNAVFRVSKKKNSKMFPYGAFFSCVFDEMFIEVPQFHESFPILKNIWLLAYTQILFFLQKGSILNV